MQKKSYGIDIEVELPKVTSTEALPGATITERKVAQAWDKLADSWSTRYTEHGDINRQYVIDPTLLRLMSPVKARSILDAGCGNGYLSRQLARKGAKVNGVDISRRFIQMARQKEKESPLGIKYYVGSLCHLSMFKDETFDIIVSNIVLSDVSDLDGAIGEFCRVTKKGGKLVFSVMHPCFSSPTVCGWVRKPEDSQRKEDWLYWKVDQYFDRSAQIWRYYDWPPAYSFHRPLSDYVKLLIENDFIITEFEEPIPSKKATKDHYREFGNECDRIPWFLVIGAKRKSISGCKLNKEGALDTSLK
jgi:2-polyprenyl-3-methyl-5-hydroxy-6-metoxy-1,4-benzoquinol methylase